LSFIIKNYKTNKMNIFFLHLNPRICAQYHLDKHVVKMCLEHTQILCSVYLLTESKYKPPYKLTHKNHPCNVWARTSLNNFKWLIEMSIELCKEYTYRYGKVHKCEQYILDMAKEENYPNIPSIGFTPPAQAMPDMYKGSDAVESYRQYYFFDKHYILSWKKRCEPEWVDEIRKMFERE